MTVPKTGTYKWILTSMLIFQKTSYSLGPDLVVTSEKKKILGMTQLTVPY